MPEQQPLYLHEVLNKLMTSRNHGPVPDPDDPTKMRAPTVTVECYRGGQKLGIVNVLAWSFTPEKGLCFRVNVPEEAAFGGAGADDRGPPIALVPPQLPATFMGRPVVASDTVPPSVSAVTFGPAGSEPAPMPPPKVAGARDPGPPNAGGGL